MRIHLARMDVTTRAYVCQQLVRAGSRCVRPCRRLLARMHQRMDARRHKPVVEEKVFFDTEGCVPALEVPRAVVRDTVTKREVLGTRRRADRIGLDEPEPLDRALQADGSEERPRNRKGAK